MTTGVLDVPLKTCSSALQGLVVRHNLLLRRYVEREAPGQPREVFWVVSDGAAWVRAVFGGVVCSVQCVWGCSMQCVQVTSRREESYNTMGREVSCVVSGRRWTRLGTLQGGDTAR